MRRKYFVLLFQFLVPSLLLSQGNPGSVNPARDRFPFSADTLHESASSASRQFNPNVPLSFEANQGQVDKRVKYLSRNGGQTVFLTADEAVMALPRTSGGGTLRALRMKLSHANLAAQLKGLEELTGTSNYFIGSDPSRWYSNVPTFTKVKYSEIYPGIDLVYYGNQRQLEYDFIVSPRANPHLIGFDVTGARSMRIDMQGDLVLKVGEEQVRWRRPVAYQENNGARQLVPVRYQLRRQHVGFELASYDVNRRLYIDPLLYSTYLGGHTSDWGQGIAVDRAGNTYITGITESTDFPATTGVLQPTCHIGNNVGCFNVFVTKINSLGSALVYSTFLGGTGGDTGFAIAVDSSGNAYVTGDTASSDFPTTAGAFRTASPCGGVYACKSAFVSKINATGSALLYSTYLGGSRSSSGFGIAVDGTGHAYVAGSTISTDFPTTAGAFQRVFNGFATNAFVTKFNFSGSGLLYSTYLGGSDQVWGDKAYGIAVDSAGSAYVTGYAGSRDFPTTAGAFQISPGGTFVTKLNQNGSALVFSTYLGVRGLASAIAVDGAGDAYVTGDAESSGFPVTAGAFQTSCGGGGNYGCMDAFVTALNPSGSGLIYSTLLGGGEHDFGTGIAVDSSHNAYVTGFTDSPNFPTAHPLQPQLGCFYTCPTMNAFVAKVNQTGSALVYSTYLGDSVNSYAYYLGEPGVSPQGGGIAVDNAGNAHVVGATSSLIFPTANPLQPFVFGSDAFVAEISAQPSDINLSRLHLYFVGQPTSVASSPQVPLLNNTSNNSLTINSISITGANSTDFSQTNDCGISVPAHSSCSISVTFTPTAVGNRSAAVEVVSSDAPQSISLTGLGLLYTVTQLSSTKNPSALGSWVTFGVAVSSPAGGIPTGNVSILNGTTLLKVKPLVNGKASYSTNTLPLGLNVIRAEYSGDATYGFSSAAINQVVLEASTTTTLTSSPNPSSLGQIVTFTAVVTSSKGLPPPDGEIVSFMTGAKVLGTGTLIGGSASFKTSALKVGTTYIKARYGGDAQLVGSMSKLLAQVVN